MERAIETDIEKHICDKLALWMKDSLTLCEIGELNSMATASIVLKALLWCLISSLMQKGASKEYLLEIVGRNWDLMAKLKAEKKV